MKKIVVVDDNTDVAESITIILELEGFVAECFTSYADAWQHCDPNDVGVVICDARTPDMQFEDFVQQVRDVNPGIIIVLISGDARSHERGIAACVDLFLLKPFDPDEVLRVARHIVGRE